MVSAQCVFPYTRTLYELQGVSSREADAVSDGRLSATIRKKSS